MSEEQNEEAKREPKSELGKSMVEFAKRIDNWSREEPGYTHRDAFVSTVGFGTLLGGGIVALAAPFVGAQYIDSEQIGVVLSKLATVRTNYYFNGGLTTSFDPARNYAIEYAVRTNFDYLRQTITDPTKVEVPLDEFARSLVSVAETMSFGDRAVQDHQTVNLLTGENALAVQRLLDQIVSKRDLIEKFGTLMALSGLANAVIGSFAKTFSDEKIVNSDKLVPLVAKAADAVGRLL